LRKSAAIFLSSSTTRMRINSFSDRKGPIYCL
jgi:hypothetical protein